MTEKEIIVKHGSENMCDLLNQEQTELKKATIEEMAKRLPTIEEIEREYKEWAVDLLRVRFDLKPEAFDAHHKNNYSFENCADCLWNKIKGSIEELLWLREKQPPEGAVVLTEYNAEDVANMIVNSSGMKETMDRLIKAWQKETAMEFVNETVNRKKTLIIPYTNDKVECISTYWIYKLAKQFGVEVKK